MMLLSSQPNQTNERDFTCGQDVWCTFFFFFINMNEISLLLSSQANQTSVS